MSTSIIFDIETGPRPWAEIEQFYEAPEPMPPFDESMVKYGQLKDPAKRAEKLAEVKTKYQALGGNGKPDDCTGATFAKLYLSGDPEDKAKAEAYLRNDLEMTWNAAERMGLL
jgi:hypothetical protein